MPGNSINEILTKLKQPGENGLEQPERQRVRDRLGSIWLPLLLTAIVGAATLFQAEKLIRQSAALDKQQIQLDQLQAQLDFSVPNDQLKIRRAETIKQVFDEFAHTDVMRKKLAIESVRMLLSGNDAARLIGLLEKDADDETVKAFAREALRIIRRGSIADLYSDRASDRKAAYNTLLERWGKDPALIQHLFAQYDRLSNAEGPEITRSGLENGLYNTLVLLGNIDPAVIRDKSSMIEAFTKRLTDVGEKTQERKTKLLERIGKAK